jgi:hypothetical protein
LIENNPKLCHMNEIEWDDILEKSNQLIRNNADPANCKSCSQNCPCFKNQTNTKYEKSCHCWTDESCQKLTKVVCDKSSCNKARCYGPKPNQCCDKECVGGCTGPSKMECTACKTFRIVETGECVTTCPRIYIPDSNTGKTIVNPHGMYIYGNNCVKKCPPGLFIYKDEFCMKKCPSGTYEREEIVTDVRLGQNGIQRFCAPCTPNKCPKTCYFSHNQLMLDNIHELEGCEILNNDLNIVQVVDSLSNEDSALRYK